MWSAAWAWLYLVLGVTVYVAVFDVTAHRRGVLTMTAQFRDWLFDPVTGPFIWAGTVAVVAGFLWHMLVRAR